MIKNLELSDCSVDVRLRIRDGTEPVFGSGICMLLRKTELHESLKAAADEMGMNYKKALKIVKRAEEFYGTALLLRSAGGSGGGGSSLTDFAAELITEFENLEAALMRCTKELTEKSPLVFSRRNTAPQQ